MNLIWRLLYTILVSHFQKKISLFDIACIKFRVLPTDIDFLMHLNNGRYLSFLDLARTNFIIRNEKFSIFKKQKIYAVVASEMIRFKRSINLWQKFEIITEIIGWDQKYIYVGHYFKTKGNLAAFCLVKSRFMQNKKPIAPDFVFESINHHVPSPPLPEWVYDWQKADQIFYEYAIAKKI